MWQVLFWRQIKDHPSGGYHAHDSLHDTKELADERAAHLKRVTNEGIAFSVGYLTTLGWNDNYFKDIAEEQAR